MAPSSILSLDGAGTSGEATASANVGLLGDIEARELESSGCGLQEREQVGMSVRAACRPEGPLAEKSRNDLASQSIEAFALCLV